MQLTGCAALITGGKRIGAEVAIDLAARGADVAIAYNRSEREARAAVARAEGEGRRAIALQADLADPAQCRRLVDEAAATLGRLDVLVNMASVYRSVPLDETGVDVWDSVVNVDLRAAFLCAQAAIPHMRSGGRGGRIINFADWLAASGRPRYKGFLPYYVAKHGVIGLTEALAIELAGEQILVNAIAPGPIVAPPGTSQEESASVEAATPLGRWGGEAEIVKAVAFLIASDFVTGETIRVDGGRHIR
ncbi:MAG TPA: SDR family oxidoreductase [Vicinamibacterales bacterium]|nr:SDR family oxidoreductase [Vicinamibacterales bacterium]